MKKDTNTGFTGIIIIIIVKSMEMTKGMRTNGKDKYICREI